MFGCLETRLITLVEIQNIAAAARLPCHPLLYIICFYRRLQQVAKHGWRAAEPLPTVIMWVTNTFRRSLDICYGIFVTTSGFQTSEKNSDPNHVLGFHSLYYPLVTVKITFIILRCLIHSDNNIFAR